MKKTTVGILLIFEALHCICARNTVDDERRYNNEDSSANFTCYYADKPDPNLFIVDHCTLNVNWCLKLTNNESTIQIRQCDPGNICAGFGARCGSAANVNISNIHLPFLDAYTLCCCADALCNGGANLRAFSGDGIIALLRYAVTLTVAWGVAAKWLQR